MENNTWIQEGNSFTKGSANTIPYTNGLPAGVYEVQQSMMGYYLNKVADNFVFDYKLYGISNDFVDYVIKTYNNTTGNLGILFTGLKGTGKTVTAKILCNKLQLPVILIKSCKKVEEMLNYVATQITFECIFFFDEYEKEFEDSSEVLSFMDGVHNSEKRKVFLLTTNTLNINDNLIGRPSRIRYVKSFDNLSEGTVLDILNDTVIDSKSIPPIQELIQQMPIVTIDLVKNLAQEVNIHGVENIDMIKQIFNIEISTVSYASVILTITNTFWEKHSYEESSYEEIIKNYELCTQCAHKKTLTKNENQALHYQEQYYYSRNDIINSTKKFCSLKVGDEFNDNTILFISIKNKYIVSMAYDSSIYIYKIKNMFTPTSTGLLNLAL